MAGLTPGIPDDTHRRLRTLAAYLGMTMKDFLISRALAPAGSAMEQPGKSSASDEAGRLDDLLFSQPSFRLSPENRDAFRAALDAPANPNPALRKLMSTPGVPDER